MDVGPAELIIVLLIVLLVFGGAKLPKLARSMGEAAHVFRMGIAGGADDDEKAAEAEATKPSVEASTPEPKPPTGSNN